MNRRALIALALCYAALLGLGMALGAFIHHQRSLVSFMVDIPRGSTVKVYADQGGDAPFQYNPAKPLFTLSESQTIKTKVGVYDFVIDKADDYQSAVKKATVNNATSRVTVNPDFSQERLDTLLANEKPAIGAALSAKFSNIGTYYDTGKIELYKHGEWAGVSLKPKSNAYDPVRFVLNKKGGTWTVVNDPSIFVLGSLYKNVPQDVVVSINSL